MCSAVYIGKAVDVLFLQVPILLFAWKSCIERRWNLTLNAFLQVCLVGVALGRLETQGLRQELPQPCKAVMYHHVKGSLGKDYSLGKQKGTSC